MLLDFVQSGASLIAAREYIERCYARLDVKVRVEIVPIIDSLYASPVVPELSKTNSIYVLDEALRKSLALEHYDAYAEFGSFDVERWRTQKLDSNPRFDDLVEEFTRRLGDPGTTWSN